MVSEWSTQVLHPSGQSWECFSACWGPRCSTHPGHVQSNPHVQPVPAREATALRGGMAGNSGGGRAGESAEVGGMHKIGGSEGPFWMLLFGEGLLDRERWRRRFAGGEEGLEG